MLLATRRNCYRRTVPSAFYDCFHDLQNMVPEFTRSSVRFPLLNRLPHFCHTKNPIVSVTEPMCKRNIGGRFFSPLKTKMSTKKVGVRPLQGGPSPINPSGGKRMGL